MIFKFSAMKFLKSVMSYFGAAFLVITAGGIVLVQLNSKYQDTATALLCVDGILDKLSFNYSRNQGFWAMEPIFKPPCKLRQYTKSDILECLDKLSNNNAMAIESAHARPDDNNGEIHLVFVGDSRIRQHYYAFLELLPWQDDAQQLGAVHADMKIQFPQLNNLTVSFHWHPVLSDKLIHLIHKWVDTQIKWIPHYIVFGISAHHMIQAHGEDHRPFERILRTDLSPVLDKLGHRMRERSNGRIVWMNQYPAMDYLPGSIDAYNTKIHTEKLEHYNSIARQIFRNNSAVQVWDSVNPLVEEYTRSCLQLRRSANFSLDTWIDCLDYIHPGFVILTQANQMLLNDICNSLM